MILLLDNFDSFTYNLVDYFHQLKIEVKVFRNNISLEEITQYQYEGVVLSPGPETPSKAGNLLAIIDYYKDLPMLGICLGHQAIGEYFGGIIEKALKPVHGKCSLIEHEQKGLFQTLPNPLKVVRYHSLIISKLPICLRSTAWTEANEIMGLEHKKLPIYGVQFHPESILTEFGIDLLRNWIEINQINIIKN